MNIVFITGGARSGKSSFALTESSKADGEKAFVATAEALDEDMKQRIEKHIIERGSDWSTYEEPVRIVSILDKISGKYQAIVLDCLTIWLSNLLVRTELAEPDKQTTDETIEEFINLLHKLRHRTRTLDSGLRATNEQQRLFIISNEVGMGIVPENKLARQFRDLAGILNQKVAEIADEVYTVTVGIPVRIK